MSNRTLTEEQRRDIVRYRMENARKMLEEVKSHRSNGFYSRLFSKRSTGDYDDFINHTLTTVDELLPQACLFVNTLGEQLDDWLA